MAIFLVRHGETRLSGTYCGSTNPPLNPRGRDQIKAAARILDKYPIDFCYASPLVRTQQTAKILNSRLKLPVQTRLALREMHFGAWESLKFEEIAQRWPRLAEQWMKNPTAVRIPKGETFEQVRGRAKRFLQAVKDRMGGRNVLVVSHGGTLAALVLEILRLPSKDFAKHMQPLGSIRMIEKRAVTWIHPVSKSPC